MKNIISSIFSLGVGAAFLSGCTSFSPGDIAKPSSLTVEAAMTDLGKGFAGLKRELKKEDNLKLGLYPCKVTANFNVTASAEKGGKLVLDASTAPTTAAQSSQINTVSAAAHVEQTNTSSATRGNTIAIEMYNVACLPKDTLATISPDKVAVVAKAMSDPKYFEMSPYRLKLPPDALKNIAPKQ